MNHSIGSSTGKEKHRPVCMCLQVCVCVCVCVCVYVCPLPSYTVLAVINSSYLIWAGQCVLIKDAYTLRELAYVRRCRCRRVGGLAEL